MRYETRSEGRERPRNNWDKVEANWNQFKGNVKKQWGKLTNDHLDEIEGRRDRLVGKVQEVYGLSAEDADDQVDRFMDANSASLDRPRDRNMH